MDERRLDQFFKEELEEFPQPKLKEGAWERMRSRLPEPKSRQGLWTWLSLASLLLLASLIVNFFLWNRFQNQQTQIHTLSKNISAIQHQFSSKTDTLYICQTDSIFIQNTPVYYTRPQGSVTSYDLKESSPKFASTQPDNKIDVSPNQASSSIEQSLKTDADTSNSATEKSTSFLTKTEESTTKIEPSTITESGNTPNAKDTVFIKTETRRVDTVFADSKATPKAKKNQMLKDIKEYFTSRGLAWGLLSEIGTFSTAVADEGNAFGFGLGVQGSISPRFSLYSAFRFRRSFYKIC